MIKYLDYQRILDLYKKYFNTVSYIQGRTSGPIPFLTNNEYYTVLDNFTKYQTFYEEVISQSVFKTTEADKLFEVINQSAASIKSIYSKFKDISDPFKVSSRELDNLLLSFGFPVLNFPEYTKRQLLLNLISNYKIKGSLNSLQNILNILLPVNVKITELEFKKISGIPYFVEKIPIEVPGFFDEDFEITFPINSFTVNDQHWWLDQNSINNWPIGRAMSPYFSINAYSNTMANLAAVILLRTYAERDYDVYLTGTSSDYEDTKQITLNNLPIKINYLELYELIRYIIIKREQLEGIVHDDPNKRNYAYSPPDEDYDVIVDEINAQFGTRYTNQFGDIVSETRNCIYDSVLHSIPLCRLPSQAEAQTFSIPDLIGATSIVFNNKIVLVGGKFQTSGIYNTRLYIIDGYSTTNIFWTDIGISLTYPVISIGASCNTLCITGGYDSSGNPNYHSWSVNLNTYSVTQISDIPEKLWMHNPLVVSTPNDLTYVISTSETDNCPGGIFLWNICTNYKKLLAYLNPDHYDLSTIKAICDNKSRLYLKVRSKLSNGVRIVLLDPHPERELFLDITCQIIKSIPTYLRPNFTTKLYEDDVMLISAGNKIFIIYPDITSANLIFHEITIEYLFGDIKKKLVPNYFSGMLIPSRICKPCPVYENSVQLYQDFCEHNFHNYGLTIDNIEQYGDYYFVNVVNKETGEKCYYWPLMKQIYSLCCNSESARITKILPPVYNLIYDSTCVYDIWDEFDPTCYFYFICYNPIDYDIGPYENVGAYTFEDVFKLSHAQNVNDHFCYDLYDSCHDYDTSEVGIKITCLSAYPDVTSTLEANMHYNDLLKVYKAVEMPEYIDIIFQHYMLSFDLSLCNFSGSDRYTLSSSIATYSLHYEDSTGTIINILNLYPKVVKLIAHSCDFTYTEDEDLARGFRKKMLEEREDKLIEDNEVLPVFNDFQDLCNFLTSTTLNNKLTIDSSENLDEIFYELLMVASALYPNADLTLLFPGYSFSQIKPIMDIFKPIYSRATGVTIFMMVPDPIGDWITFENSIEFHHFKTLASWVKMDDCFAKLLNIVLKDYIHVDGVKLIDLVKIMEALIFSSYISLSDVIQHLQQNVTESFYDSIFVNMLEELKINKNLSFSEYINNFDDKKFSIQMERSEYITLFDDLIANRSKIFYDYITMFDYPYKIIGYSPISYISTNDHKTLVIQKSNYDYTTLFDNFNILRNKNFYEYITMFDFPYMIVNSEKFDYITLFDSKNKLILDMKQYNYITLFDAVEAYKSKLFYDTISVFDEIFMILTEKFFEYITIFDYSKSNIIKHIGEYTTLFDYQRKTLSFDSFDYTTLFDVYDISVIVDLIYDNGTNEIYDNHWWS